MTFEELKNLKLTIEIPITQFLNEDILKEEIKEQQECYYNDKTLLDILESYILDDSDIFYLKVTNNIKWI